MKRKHIIAYVVAFAGIALTGILSYTSLSKEFKSVPTPYMGVKQKGVCWVGGREVVTQKEIIKLKECGVTWISQTPFGWQEHVDSPSIRFETNSDRMWWGESSKGIAVTTQLADSAGIKVMLKPHLWARGGWPGDINMKSQTDWNEWFSQYSDFILTYARLAEELKIPILCIGTELHHSSKQEKSWRELIKKIRLAYRGKLTYAANFHEEFEHVKFWDALDYIGIQGYYPLSKKNDPKLEDMVVMWNAHLKNLEKAHNRFNKPVLFTEIGYRSTSDAAIEPWRWPQQEDLKNISDDVQAKCYEAFFQTAWRKSWVEGAYFWKWYPHGKSRMMEVDFSPQGKKAEAVMSTWYKKNGDEKGY